MRRKPKARERKERKRPPCADTKAWGYPPPADEMRASDPELVHYAWACRCGKNGVRYRTISDAIAAAGEHLVLRGGSADEVKVLG